jgi:hypothetical protein
MLPELQIYKIFEREMALQLFDLAQNIEEPRWTKRNMLSPGRGLEGSSCEYYFCGHSQMKKEVKDNLKSLAPRFQGYQLAEIAINKYNKSNYLGKHRDRHRYRKNIVISLQENEDGLFLDEHEKFIKDELGQAVVFNGIGPVHSVPPVKKLRFTLIYLYE